MTKRCTGTLSLPTAAPSSRTSSSARSGLFGAARYPDIEGITEFTGDLMHTSQWDARIDLAGKRMAVVGTGASGVQVIPELAATAAQLTVFQRTPPWMVPKPDRPFSIEERARFRRLPWAPLRERWRLWKLQHDNTALDSRPSTAGRGRGAIEELSAAPRRGRGDAQCADPSVSVPVQACPPRREILCGTAMSARRSRDGSDRTGHRDVPS